MQLEQVTKIDQIRQGDALLISDGQKVIPATAEEVLDVGGTVGREVIFDRRNNKYFNVGMYLSGHSWAKDVRIVRMPPNVRIEGRGAEMGEAEKPASTASLSSNEL